MLIVLNYTPHDPLRLFQGDTEVASLPSAGLPVRLAETPTLAKTVVIGTATIPILHMSYGQADGLPEPQPGRLLVASQLVCRAYPDRRDLVYPTDLVRDSAGNVIGCRAFARPAPGTR